MQFSSAIFVLFLALTILLYYLLPKKWQWGVLLVASYVFYLSQGVQYIGFLLYTTVVTYFTGRILSARAKKEDDFVEANRETLTKEERKAFRASEKKARFRILLCGLVLGFGLLILLKYTAFFAGGVRDIVTAFGGASFKIPSLLIPLGLSFYTFQSMGYLIDLYRKKITAETNFLKFALFVSFFPQIIQGPISRFGDLGKELTTPHTFSAGDFSAGLFRVAYGFFKKLVVADTAMIGVRYLYEHTDTQQGIYVILLILLYTAEIYGDFTGGIDITIGISRMLGIRLAENFNRPFSAQSVKEYWRRWHITMGTWFTDYVFYPLSVSGGMQKFSTWSRSHLGNAVGKRLPVYFATIVTWFLTGLWHGAGWNFIVWGLLNCFVILISQELQPLWNLFLKKCQKLSGSGFFYCFRAARTFLLMGLFRSLDVYKDVPLTFSLWGSMFTTWNWGELFSASGLTSFGMNLWQLLVLGAGILLILLATNLGKKTPLWDRLASRSVLAVALSACILTLVLVFGSYGVGYDAADFIYGQF
ncbi:MAG: MBOAT family protein [Clostridia bacterium]|nr:MBOAT family protein [Clostridia bacterium]